MNNQFRKPHLSDWLLLAAVPLLVCGGIAVSLEQKTIAIILLCLAVLLVVTGQVLVTLRSGPQEPEPAPRLGRNKAVELPAYTLPEGWWRPRELLDFDKLGPVIGTTTLSAHLTTDKLGWQYLAHWLPVITPEFRAQVEKSANIYTKKVAPWPPLDQRAPVVMFEWGQANVLATQQEYDTLKALSEICTHFYDTWQINASSSAIDRTEYYMRGVLRKSDEELATPPNQ